MNDDEVVYEVVSARRMQLDLLVWQVPVLGLTAQAFLFTISLGNSGQGARVVSCVLSVVATLLCIQLMAKHRKAEITDARWLEAYEHEHHPASVVHSRKFRDRRDEIAVLNWLTRWSSFWIWTIGLSLFGLAACTVFVLTVTGSTLFNPPTR